MRKILIEHSGPYAIGRILIGGKLKIINVFVLFALLCIEGSALADSSYLTLADVDESVRLKAIQDLELRGGNSAISGLVYIANNDQNEDVRIKAEAALDHLGWVRVNNKKIEGIEVSFIRKSSPMDYVYSDSTLVSYSNDMKASSCNENKEKIYNKISSAYGYFSEYFEEIRNKDWESCGPSVVNPNDDIYLANNYELLYNPVKALADQAVKFESDMSSSCTFEIPTGSKTFDPNNEWDEYSELVRKIEKLKNDIGDESQRHLVHSPKDSNILKLEEFYNEPGTEIESEPEDFDIDYLKSSYGQKITRPYGPDIPNPNTWQASGLYFVLWLFPAANALYEAHKAVTQERPIISFKMKGLKKIRPNDAVTISLLVDNYEYLNLDDFYLVNIFSSHDRNIAMKNVKCECYIQKKGDKSIRYSLHSEEFEAKAYLSEFRVMDCFIPPEVQPGDYYLYLDISIDHFTREAQYLGELQIIPKISEISLHPYPQEISSTELSSNSHINKQVSVTGKALYEGYPLKKSEISISGSASLGTLTPSGERIIKTNEKGEFACDWTFNLPPLQGTYFDRIGLITISAKNLLAGDNTCTIPVGRDKISDAQDIEWEMYLFQPGQTIK